MNVLNRIKGIKYPYTSSVAIFSVIILVVCWISQGCVQQSPKNTAPTGTSVVTLMVPPISPQQQAPQSPPQQIVTITSTPPPITQQSIGQQPVPVLELEKQLLDFQKTLSQNAKEHHDFLQAEEARHQQFLEWCYDFSVKFFSSCVVIIGLILTGLHYKTRGDIKKLVDERINTDIDAQIAKAIKLTDDKVKAAVETANNFNINLEKLQTGVQTRVDNLITKLEIDNPNIIKLASVIARASVLLAQYPSEDAETRKANNKRRSLIIQLLKEIQNWAPTDRTIVIYIGRLYRQLGDYKAAVNELNAVIAKRISAGENKAKDQNYSDILFNKACYLNLIARTSEGAVREQLQNEAWATLTEAIKIWPHNFTDAQCDEDLTDLKSSERDLEKLKP